MSYTCYLPVIYLVHTGSNMSYDDIKHKSAIYPLNTYSDISDPSGYGIYKVYSIYHSRRIHHSQKGT